MKIAKVTLGLSVLSTAGLLLGCTKPTTPVAPVADTETQTAVDVSWATYVVTDIDMMCSFLGVNQPLDHFYIDIPGTASSTEGMYDYTRDESEDRLSMNFNKTKCMDGRIRSGEVRLVYDPSLKINPHGNMNSDYYHEFGFGGRLTLTDYRVDGWYIYMKEPGYIYNELVENKWDPKTTKLKWKIVGKFYFQHPTDSTGSSDMIWDGQIWKVLENTSDPKVYNATRTPAITWSLSTCSYYGNISGTTNSVVPYQMNITDNQKLVRDFTCSPDRVGGVDIDDQNNLETRSEEHHPFIKGIASFTTGDKYPRQIYFGNESNPGLAQQCDNTGEVMIKGIAYRVNFRK